MIPNILAQCAGAAAAAYSAERLRGYPTGAIPIADGNEWTVFAVEGIDDFLIFEIPTGCLHCAWSAQSQCYKCSLTCVDWVTMAP